MACPASGTITIQDIVNEFGGTAPHSMSEYYRNGGEVPGNNTNVPTSGAISLENFYSAVNEIQQSYSSTNTNLNLASVFGSNWATAVPKRVTINSSAVIGATSVSNPAILIPSGMGGTLVIDNSGSIEGAGGSANGGNGGNAINCVQTSGVTINNLSGAYIRAGGGGGGQGGTGGTGGNGGAGGTGGGGQYDYVHHTVSCNLNVYPFGYGDNDGSSEHHNRRYYCILRGGDGRYQNVQICGPAYYGYNRSMECLRSANSNGGSGGAGGTSGGSGGSGGAGGRGQGYNQSAQNGSGGAAGAGGSSGSGGSAGGQNAGAGGTGGSAGQGGTGGTGGNGGSFGNAGGQGNAGAQGNTGATGNSGANGNRTNGSAGSGGSAGTNGTSGSGGGSAGTYITNRSSITFNNSGTVGGN